MAVVLRWNETLATVMTEISKIIDAFQRHPALLAKYGWVIEDLSVGPQIAEPSGKAATMNLLAGQSEGSEVQRSVSSTNLTEPEPYLYVLMSAGIIDVPEDFGPKQKEEWISRVQGKMAALFGKSLRRQPIRDFLDRDDLERLLDKERGLQGTEGVTKERSYQVEEDKLKGGQLPEVFEAQLNRQALADALNAVMAKERLSEQKVADRTGFRKNDVNRARNGNATIDKTSEILVALGYPPTFSIPDLE